MFMVMIGINKLYSQKLPLPFYRRQQVVKVAKALMGKLLVTYFDGELCVGRITETEAYDGVNDRASHAWNGRYTPRTATMYQPGGIAYVYLCYGIHHLFNVVTGLENHPQAVLIRSVEPLKGINTMLMRTGKKQVNKLLCAGPGNVSKAMGIHSLHNAANLQSKELFIADDRFAFPSRQILATPRIGVDFAGDHAQWPYRFIVANHPFISGRFLQNNV